MQVQERKCFHYDQCYIYTALEVRRYDKGPILYILTSRVKAKIHECETTCTHDRRLSCVEVGSKRIGFLGSRIGGTSPPIEDHGFFQIIELNFSGACRRIIRSGRSPLLNSLGS